MGKRLVSLSLYGKDPKYLQGIIENAKLMPKIYPGWVMRVYCDNDVFVQRLWELGCETVFMGYSNEHSGMLWRFLPIWEVGIERVVFRDADSRINWREAEAVKAWIASDLDAHVMQDHPHHGCLPIFGGMWGVKGGVIPNMILQWARWMSGLARRVEDMQVLRTSVWPHIQNSVIRHTSVPTNYSGGLPFPPHAPVLGFVGQRVEADGSREWGKF